MCLLLNTKFVKNSIEVLLLIKVDCTVLSVAGDSHSKDLLNLPQILSVESLRELLVEPVDLALLLCSGSNVVNINQEAKTSFLMNEHARVCFALHKAPCKKFLLD